MQTLIWRCMCVNLNMTQSSCIKSDISTFKNEHFQNIWLSQFSGSLVKFWQDTYKASKKVIIVGIKWNRNRQFGPFWHFCVQYHIIIICAWHKYIHIPIVHRQDWVPSLRGLGSQTKNISWATLRLISLSVITKWRVWLEPVERVRCVWVHNLDPCSVIWPPLVPHPASPQLQERGWERTGREWRRGGGGGLTPTPPCSDWGTASVQSHWF